MWWGEKRLPQSSLPGKAGLEPSMLAYTEAWLVEDGATTP
jgi:hypothetical protein